MPYSRIDIRELIAMRGRPVYGADGEKLGELDDVYQDQDTQQPEWIAIKEAMVGGLLGTKHFLVPVMEAQLSSEGEEEAAIRVPYSKEKVKDSPQVGGDWISEEQEREVYAYYGIQQPSIERSETQLPTREATTGERPATPTTRGASDEISVDRSEEELRVGKREVNAGRVRLRKWVETEPVTEDVELRHETARVERHQVDRPTSGAEIREEEAEMQLHGEESVVGKETVEKERIDVHREEEVDREQVRDEVRRERVEVEEDSSEDSHEGRHDAERHRDPDERRR